MIDLLQTAQAQMEKTYQHLVKEFSKIKADSVVPEMIEELSVNCDGAPKPLKYIASIDVKGAGCLAIYPREKRLIPSIRAAFSQNNPFNFTLADKGDCIYANRAPLTQESREGLAKQVAAKAQEGKVAIQAIRAQAKKALGKEEYSKDEMRRYTKELQNLTDGFTTKIDTLQKEKKTKLMQI